MYDECVECKNKIIQLPQFDAVKTVTFPQWATAQKEREDMKDGTTVSSEIQSVRFGASQNQATLHTGVLYLGEVLYREVSCMCSTKKQLNCQCFNTLHFSFHKPAPKAPKAPNAPIVPVEREVEREGIDWESENVIGSWCVIKYDSDLYPGIILNTDETHAQELIQPPQPVTSRHVGIEKEVWKRLSATLQ
ncbi:unnamed protein product [Boreogadus saida]